MEIVNTAYSLLNAAAFFFAAKLFYNVFIKQSLDAQSLQYYKDALLVDLLIASTNLGAYFLYKTNVLNLVIGLFFTIFVVFDIKTIKAFKEQTND